MYSAHTPENYLEVSSYNMYLIIIVIIIIIIIIKWWGGAI